MEKTNISWYDLPENILEELLEVSGCMYSKQDKNISIDQP